MKVQPTYEEQEARADKAESDVDRLCGTLTTIRSLVRAAHGLDGAAEALDKIDAYAATALAMRGSTSARKEPNDPR